jgi:N-acetylglucosaminyldiphosphoundecaprenol N-acetyl-beta-D-mannosaminyltransferase
MSAIGTTMKAGRDRAMVFDCAIDRLDLRQTVERCRQVIEENQFTYQVSINAAKVVAMRKDASLREVIDKCELVSPDGVPIVWASRLLGDPLPGRVNGTDLMYELFELAAREGYGVYILGARAEVLETAVRNLRAQYPGLPISGYRDGYFSDAESPSVAASIRASGAKILFVAISSPKKEYWLGEYGRELGVPFVMGVGGSIDIVAGVTRRAPPSWQRWGLEWFWRLLQEPRRLLGRYLVTNVRFIAMVARSMIVRLRRRLDR